MVVEPNLVDYPFPSLLTLLKYWFRLISLGTNTIAFKALLANILLHRNKSLWLKTIDSLLNLVHKTCADFQYLSEKETIAKVRNMLTSIFIKKSSNCFAHKQEIDNLQGD